LAGEHLVMNNSTSPGDQSYDEFHGVNPATTAESYANYAAVGNSHNDVYGNEQLFDMTPFDTIAPSSLSVTYAAHDDSCIDTLGGVCSQIGFHRGIPPSVTHPKARYSTSAIPFAHGLSENSDMFALGAPNPMSASGFSQSELDLNLAQHRYGLRAFQSFPQNNFLGSPYRAGVSFNIPNYGGLQQQPVPEDCSSVGCSQFSCSNDACCSTAPCEDEDCEAAGSPCDDSHCYEHNDPCNSLGGPWVIPNWNSSAPLQQNPLHNQPCNHTILEHEAIDTLRALGQASDGPVQPPQSDSSQLASPARIHQPKDLVYGSSTDPSTPPLTRETSISSAKSAARSLPAQTPGAASQDHVCQWILPTEPGHEVTVCACIFKTRQQLQTHLCDVHVTPMSTKTKFNCLWHGCDRSPGKDFASRNKLRRHINTHTGCKLCESLPRVIFMLTRDR
jgi:hypothetical protein